MKCENVTETEAITFTSSAQYEMQSNYRSDTGKAR